MAKTPHVAMSSLNCVDSSLSQYEAMLKEVHKKLDAGSKVSAALRWDFTKSDL